MAMKVIKSDGSVPESAAPALRPRGVVDKEEFEALTGAREIIAKAQQQAQEIIAGARAQEQRIHEAAKAAGREEGRVEVSAELARSKQQAAMILRNAEQDIISLALEIARKIIGRDLERDPAVVMEICANAIEGVRNAKQLVLRVNPENGAYLRQNRKAIMDLVARSVDIAFKDDPTVEPGGCVIQTEFGTIDGQLDTQFKMLAQVLIADTAKKEGPA
ncbi:MAG TPA: type III secretion system stator protein SctL [Myxococcales bacterium]|jgi:type III secretion protein L|nr:type III secretion system stator protein SctL [Myxococcales bacterium]